MRLLSDMAVILTPEFQTCNKEILTYLVSARAKLGEAMIALRVGPGPGRVLTAHIPGRRASEARPGPSPRTRSSRVPRASRVQGRRLWGAHVLTYQLPFGRPLTSQPLAPHPPGGGHRGGDCYQAARQSRQHQAAERAAATTPGQLPPDGPM